MEGKEEIHEENKGGPEGVEMAEPQLSENIQYYEWDHDMTKLAEQIVADDEGYLDDEKVQKLENYQRLHWDVFYKNNNVYFFKDRHYIKHEFVELTNLLECKGQEVYTLLDYGCGVGNGFYPLLETFGKEHLRVNCCDLSKTAVALVKKHDLYDE